MLKSSENFVNCKEICYRSVKFHIYSPLGDTKSVGNIRIRYKVKFCKDYLRTLQGTLKNFALSYILLPVNTCSYETSFTASQISIIHVFQIAWICQSEMGFLFLYEF